MSIQNRPNILFITTDQQSATMMSCTGNNYVNTPAMDYLASIGVRFEKAYCCNPVCLPSRFSYVSGRYPSDIKVRCNNSGSNASVPEYIRRESIGNLMKNAGYNVGYSGKTHLPPGMRPDQIGFEFLTNNDRDECVEKSIEFIKRKHEKPFFLFTSLINPHDICYMAIRAFADSEHSQRILKHGKTECETLDKALKLPTGVSEEQFFANYCPPLPPNYDKQEDEPEAIELIREQRFFKKMAAEKWGKKEWRMHRWAYCQLTEMVDRQIARIIEALKQTGLEENTVIIFTSDHGDHDSSHRLEHKSTAYEECSRIPFIVSQKGKTAAGTVNNSHLISSGLDLIATCCDYAETELPDSLTGLSFRSLAEGKTPKTWRQQLWVESEFCDMIRTENYKYVMYHEGKSREQLYDMVNDPYEMRNAACDTDKQDVLKHHRQLFEETNHLKK